MMSDATAILVGNLVSKPEARVTASGKKVANFTVACNGVYSQEGLARNVSYFRVSAWNQNADFISEYGEKGDIIYVKGDLAVDYYKDENGVDRSFTRVVASKIVICCHKNGDGDSKESSGKKRERPKFVEIADNSDLPF